MALKKIVCRIGCCCAGLLCIAWVGCAEVGRTAGNNNDNSNSGSDAGPVDAFVPGDGVAPLPDAAVLSDALVPTDGAVVQNDAAGCSSGCTTPLNDCYLSPGQCVGTTCVYSYKSNHTPCNDGDVCTAGDECDGAGHCDGEVVTCDPANTHGGYCSGGACVGITCDTNYANCDSDLEGSGCETHTVTGSDCGGCGIPCTAAAHATASCSTGSCQQSCVSPWENCDGSWSNGCEIPTGIANQCDVGGLNSTTGCWTAWCGTASGADEFQMSGNWYCAKCGNCQRDTSGSPVYTRWCGPSGGEWYGWAAEDTCGGTYENAVCGP